MKRNNSTNSNSELKRLAEIVYNSYSKNLPKYKYYLMDHRGGLNEALETLKQIDSNQFKQLLKKYSFYGYDERIECLRFILDDMEHDNSPVWLMISTLNLNDIKEKRV